MKLTNNYILQTILDESSLIPTVGSKVRMDTIINLNETAVFIYKLLEKNYTKDQIVEEMAKEYDAPKDVISKDVDELLAFFIKKGIVE